MLKMKIPNDREFLEQSLNWPRWPVLPVIKRGDSFGSDEESTGFLYSFSREPEPIVYFGNVFGFNEMADALKIKLGVEAVTWQQMLATLNNRRFASLDAVLEVYRVD